ncbi:MAG: DUF4416 family protein, partial [Planctomycetota bacterium]
MGNRRTHRRVLLITAVISRYDEAFEWTRQKMTDRFGAVEFEGPVFDFDQTSFYSRTMGEGLKKQFLAFSKLLPPDEIADAKVFTNQLEEQFADSNQYPESRPLNIDPGYVTEAKLVLATTKDRDHRIYLRDGIFAEVTLHYQGDQWQTSRWTYPDYDLESSRSCFLGCRK